MMSALTPSVNFFFFPQTSMSGNFGRRNARYLSKPRGDFCITIKNFFVASLRKVSTKPTQTRDTTESATRGPTSSKGASEWLGQRGT
jgi:hypothetical protein